VWRTQSPQLQLVYVPHLDYDLQRFGPSSPQAAQAVQDVAAALEPLLETVLAGADAKLVVLSESEGRQLALIHPEGEELETRLRDGLRQVRARAGAGAVATVVEVAPWSRIPEARALVVPRDV